MPNPYFKSLIQYKHFLEKEKATFTEKYVATSKSHRTFSGLNVISTIGVGSFARVLLVQDKSGDSSYYALKVVLKKLIIQTKQIPHVLSEKRTLQVMNFVFTMHLMDFFMDNSYIYIAMPFIAGGDLFRLFQNEGPFEENEVKFYAAQIVLALQYLHHLDIIYRDLKPENLLIDITGYLKLADFGLAKVVKGRTYTLCGTPDYIAPEAITNVGYGKTVDFWSLGVLIYELRSGYTPFFAPNLMALYERITTETYYIPESFNSNLRDLIKKLIVVDRTRRLGNLQHGIMDITEHGWFKEIRWLDILNREVQPPHVPYVSGPTDTDNFDPIYDLSDLEPVDNENKYRHEFMAF